MKYIIIGLLIFNISKAEICKNIEIFFIKDNKIAKIQTKVDGKVKYGIQTPSYAKKIFKYEIVEHKIKNGKWEKYSFKKLELINPKDIKKLNYSLFGSELTIYASPYEEVIENFKFRGCGLKKED